MRWTRGSEFQRANQGSSSTSSGPVTADRLASSDYCAMCATVVLGSQQYNQSCTLDGRPSVALSIFALPGSNALSTANGV